MHNLPVITDGSVSQVDMLAALLADAFEHDPVMNWVIPAALLYPAFFRLLLRDIFLPRGLVHLDEEARAAALWLPPGEKFDVRPSIGLARLILQLLLRKGPAPLLRKTFSVDKDVVSARAYVTGLGFFELYVNGEKVWEGQKERSAEQLLTHAMIRAPADPGAIFTNKIHRIEIAAPPEQPKEEGEDKEEGESDKDEEKR